VWPENASATSGDRSEAGDQSLAFNPTSYIAP